MSVDLKGKVAVISGANGQLGHALITEFVLAGASLWLLTSKAEELSLWIRRQPFLVAGTINPLHMDISDPDSFQLVSEYIVKQTPVDILINNAGMNPAKKYSEWNDKDFREAFQINAVTPGRLMNIFGQNMCKRRRGAIVNVASVKGTEASADVTYGATKAALIQMTKTYAKEFGRYNVRVNTVSPGPLHGLSTERMPDQKKRNYISQIALARFGRVNEVAKVIRFVASDDASYLNGINIRVDGGYRL